MFSAKLCSKHTKPLYWHLQLYLKKALPLLLLWLGQVLNAQADGPSVKFEYKHHQGQQYHILAQVDEQIYRNRKLVYNTQILNRIAIKVSAMVAGNALLNVNYQISENAENGRFFSWAEETDTQFGISPLGIYQNLSKDATIPSLRNVPSFPDQELRPGEGWRAPGSEIQDLSEVFGIPVKLRFDFMVDYMYRGEEIFQGRKLKHLTLVYSISEDVSKQLPSSLQPSYDYSLRRRQQEQAQNQDLAQQDIPRSMQAQHNIELYWDSVNGLPVFQSEDFEISYLMQNSDEVKFRGRSRGNIIQAKPMEHKDIQRELEKDLQTAGIDADVQRNDKGISISIDSINFYPDSERMLPGEEQKLKRISSILQKYPDRDILVTGHTADLGKPEQQQQLSENRAATVGQFFIENGVRSREQTVIQGVGGTEPVAPNNTEQGRKQNRRVEITILEN